MTVHDVIGPHLTKLGINSFFTGALGSQDDLAHRARPVPGNRGRALTGAGSKLLWGLASTT